MKNFKIVIVLVLLSLKTGVNSSCMETLIATSNALTESIKELEETKAELEKVRAELEAERNKSTDQPDKEKPQSMYCVDLFILVIQVQMSKY